MPEPRDPLLKVLTDLSKTHSDDILSDRVRVGVSGGHSPGGGCPPTALPTPPEGRGRNGPAEATWYDRHGWEDGHPEKGHPNTR